MDYIERMKVELKELRRKAGKLKTALTTLEVTPKEHNLMSIQYFTMVKYIAILEERINLANQLKEVNTQHD